jgi:pimeloyl-ACP methyl ester carboxylesterase
MSQLTYLDPNPGGKIAVLFLHGLGANGASWSLQLPGFSEAGYRPIAPDIPGFGESFYSSLDWSLDKIACAMAGFLEELNTGPAHIIGLSMGGVIAQQFVHQYPHLVNKLILVSTFSVLRPSTFGGWAYFIRRFFTVMTMSLRAQARLVAWRVFPKPDQSTLRKVLEETISRVDPHLYRKAMRSLALFDSRKWLKEIQCPTFIITGDEDTTVPPVEQKILLTGIPKAKQVIVEGAGHAVSIDKPEEFNRVILEFIHE